MILQGVTLKNSGYIVDKIYPPQVTTQIDPYFRYTSLLVHADGTNGANNSVVTDNSVNSATIKVNGNVFQGTMSPYNQGGYSYYFDQSWEPTRISLNPGVAFGSNAYTVETWFWLDNNAFATAYGLYVGTSGHFNLSIPNANTIIVGNTIASGTYTFTVPNLVPQQWYHLAVTRNAANVADVWLNGNKSSTGDVTVLTNYTTATPNFLGYSQALGGTGYFQGYLSNFRIVIGNALYTSNFTPSTTSLTVVPGANLFTAQSPQIIDVTGTSTIASPSTAYGNPYSVPFSPFAPQYAYSTGNVGGSAYFPGNNYNNLTFTGTSINLSGDFTVEGYYYFANNSLFTGGRTLIDLRPVQIAGTNALTIGYASNLWNVQESSKVTQIGSQTPREDDWVHVAYVRSGNIGSLYINGVNIGGYSGSTFDNSLTSTNNYKLGCSISNAAPFYGYISDYRITSSALYTSSFTPPSAPLTASGGTGLLLNFTNAGIFDQTGKNNLLTYNNTSLSTSQYQFGGSSISFNGTTNYVVIPLRSDYSNSTQYNFGNGNFTIEGWAYFADLSTSRTVIQRATQGGFAAGDWTLYTSGTTLNFAAYDYNSSMTPILSGGSLSINTWYHFAVVVNGATITLYVNGTSVQSTSSVPLVNALTSNINIGANLVSTASNFMSGYIDELRISRYARYTTNFTVPNSAFPNQ